MASEELATEDEVRYAEIRLMAAITKNTVVLMGGTVAIAGLAATIIIWSISQQISDMKDTTALLREDVRALREDVRVLRKDVLDLREDVVPLVLERRSSEPDD